MEKVIQARIVELERTLSVCMSNASRAKVRVRINEAQQILGLYRKRCKTCHGQRTVNFEGAQGWDEPCPECKDDA